MHKRNHLTRLAIAATVLLATAGLAWAGSHTWRVNELFSDASGTIQFVELKECCGGNFETGAPGHNVTSLTKSYLIPGPALPPVTANRTLLFGTPAFAALPGAPPCDYVFPAGSVPFFSIVSDSVSYVPWDTMSFGPGGLPSDGVHSRNAGGVIACNSPKNFAGVTGSINVGCSLPGDVNGSGGTNGDDIPGFVRIALGAALPGDNAACAEYCTGTLPGNIAAFVADLLN